MYTKRDPARQLDARRREGYMQLTMKKTFGLMLVSMLVSVSVSAAVKIVTPEDVALKLIDDVAGDTWLEAGNVQSLRFTDLSCDPFRARKCYLDFKLKLYGKVQTVERCEISGISGYNDLIEVTKYGFDLKESAYDQVNECVSSLIDG